MIRALLFLRTHSLRNRVVAWARRLRQPKYLVSFLCGALYIYYFFLRRFHPRYGRAGAAGGMSFALPAETILVLGGAVLLVFLFVNTALIWNAARPEARLKFTEAEIAFLFPAPLSRRRLIHFNLLSAQFTVLLSSGILTAVLDRWSFLGGNILTHAVGWWLILSTLSLYGNAMTFVASRAVEAWGPGVKRRVLILLAALALFAVRALWRTAHPPGALSVVSLPGEVGGYLSGWLQMALGARLLAPFEWVVAPFAAPSVAGFFAALGLALILPGACYAAIVTLEVPFREGSVLFAGKRAQTRAARRAGGAHGRPVRYKPKRAPFPLDGRGRPEIAFLWKNLIGIQSWFNLRLVLIIVILCTVMVFDLSRMHLGSGDRNVEAVVLTVAAAAGFYILLLGPQFVRQDLRSDLLNADLLKSYPLDGWQIVAGQMLTPAIILSLLLWLAALAAGWVLLANVGPNATFGFGGRLTGLVCVAVIIPPVVLLELVVPNAAALLFPAWHQNTRTRSGGIEAIGQRLIFTFGQFLAVLLALLPAAIAAGLVALASIWWAGWGLGLLLATVSVLAIVGGEVWVGLWWLGRRFERLDIALELKP